MSLRVRLTLLNMFLVGGILLLFGTTLYLIFGYVLDRQANAALDNAGQLVMNSLGVDQRGGLVMLAEPIFPINQDVYYQVWGRDATLRYHSPDLEYFSRPLDPLNLGTVSQVARDVYRDETRLRVLSIPVRVKFSDRIIGVIQVASSMALIDRTLQNLLVVLIFGSIMAMAVAGLAGWLSISRAFKPLNLVTETALQITRADDLSRRIPYQGSPEDEIGQLILAFNQTLERLENLFNSQRRFLTDVGHELRTPLTVIKGNVDLMRRINCSDDESMDSIESEVDRLTRLVGDLLLLAQAESGRIPLAQRTVELDTVVLEVMQQMRVLAHNRLTLRLDEIDQVLVCGDKDRLKQVLVNLISNSINYTPAGGEVIVSVGKAEKEAYVRVSDTGAGIAEEDRPYIFERFYRGEKSRTRSKDGKGFGLGLSIAYWIVRNHGGRIEVSENVPKGTIFTVWLQLAQGECPDELNI